MSNTDPYENLFKTMESGASVPPPSPSGIRPRKPKAVKPAPTPAPSSSSWSLSASDGVKEFYRSKFGQELPVSAFGQSETHNKLGYDHHESMDVGLHPSSEEGRTLIDYLKQNNIPHLAFDRAVPGKATAPHIHIGNPSHRLGSQPDADADPYDEMFKSMETPARETPVPDRPNIATEVDAWAASQKGSEKPDAYDEMFSSMEGAAVSDDDETVRIEATLDRKTGQPLARTDARRRLPVDSSTVTPATFEPMGKSDFSPTAQAAYGAASIAHALPLPSEDDPGLLGRPVALHIPAARREDYPMPDDINDAYLETLGAGFRELGKRYRAETGHNLTATPDEPGVYDPKAGGFELSVSPTRSLVRIVNAYASGGIDGAREEAARIAAQERRGAVAEHVEDAAQRATDAQPRTWGETARATVADIGEASARTAHNAAMGSRALATQAVYGSESPEYERLSEEDRLANRQIEHATSLVPREDTAGKNITRGLVGTLLDPTNYVFGASTAGMLTAQGLKSAHKGAAEAGRDVMRLAPSLAAGKAVGHLTSDMPELWRQFYGRTTGGLVNALPTGGQRDPKRFAEEFAIGAMMPIGKRGSRVFDVPEMLGAARTRIIEGTRSKSFSDKMAAREWFDSKQGSVRLVDVTRDSAGRTRLYYKPATPESVRAEATPQAHVESDSSAESGQAVADVQDAPRIAERASVKPTDTQKSVLRRVLEETARDAKLSPEESGRFVSRWMSELERRGQAQVMPHEDFSAAKFRGELRVRLDESAKQAIIEDLKGHQKPVEPPAPQGETETPRIVVAARDPHTGEELMTAYVSPERLSGTIAEAWLQHPHAHVEAGIKGSPERVRIDQNLDPVAHDPETGEVRETREPVREFGGRSIAELAEKYPQTVERLPKLIEAAEARAESFEMEAANEAHPARYRAEAAEQAARAYDDADHMRGILEAVEAHRGVRLDALPAQAADPPAQMFSEDAARSAKQVQRVELLSGVGRFAGRDVVRVKMSDGSVQPFYRSTGASSKQAGRWLPFDGVENKPDGLWFNQDRFVSGEMEDTAHPLHRLGSEELKQVSDALGAQNIERGRGLSSIVEANDFLRSDAPAYDAPPVYLTPVPDLPGEMFGAPVARPVNDAAPSNNARPAYDPPRSTTPTPQTEAEKALGVRAVELEAMADRLSRRAMGESGAARDALIAETAAARREAGELRVSLRRSSSQAADAAAAAKWQAFPEDSGSLNVPRASMPQIKSEHRGAMVQFLKGRGITHTQESVAPNTLKPSQAEFSPEKVKRARGFEGEPRSILVSSDNHVVDGHHQWLAFLHDAPNEPIPVIRLNAPIQPLLIEAARFPSSGVDKTSSAAADKNGPGAEIPLNGKPPAERGGERGFISIGSLLVGTRTTPVADVITAVRRAGLLTGVRTHLRNFLSNTGFQITEEMARPFQVMADLAMSAKTVTRTVTMPSVAAVARSVRDATVRGVPEAWQILIGNKQVVTGQQLHKIQSGLPILDEYVNTVFNSMEASDHVFKVYAVRRALESQAKAQALTEKKTNPALDVRARAEYLVQSPTRQMQAEAVAYAEYATFQNDNPVSDAVKKIKDIHPVLKFGIEQAAPFDKTPTNIIARIIEYSPAGLGEAAYKYKKGMDNAKAAGSLIAQVMSPADQKAFAQTFGRGALGSGVLSLGVLLAANGMLSGVSDVTDKRERANYFAKIKAGLGNGMLLIPGSNQRVSVLGTPAGNVLALGATLYEQAVRKASSADERVTNVVKAAGRVATEQPLIKAVKDTGSVDSVSDALGSYAGSFVPTIISDAGEVIDEKARSAKGFEQRIRKRIPPGLPLNRTALPESDFISPEERGDVLRRTVRTVDPFNTTTDSGDAALPSSRSRDGREGRSGRGRGRRN